MKDEHVDLSNMSVWLIREDLLILPKETVEMKSDFPRSGHLSTTLSHCALNDGKHNYLFSYKKQPPCNVALFTANTNETHFIVNCVEKHSLLQCTFGSVAINLCIDCDKLSPRSRPTQSNQCPIAGQAP